MELPKEVMRWEVKAMSDARRQEEEMAAAIAEIAERHGMTINTVIATGIQIWLSQIGEAGLAATFGKMIEREVKRP